MIRLFKINHFISFFVVLFLPHCFISPSTLVMELPGQISGISRAQLDVGDIIFSSSHARKMMKSLLSLSSSSSLICHSSTGAKSRWDTERRKKNEEAFRIASVFLVKDRPSGIEAKICHHCLLIFTNLAQETVEKVNYLKIKQIYTFFFIKYSYVIYTYTTHTNLGVLLFTWLLLLFCLNVFEIGKSFLWYYQ